MRGSQPHQTGQQRLRAFRQIFEFGRSAIVEGLEKFSTSLDCGGSTVGLVWGGRPAGLGIKEDFLWAIRSVKVE